MIRNFSVDTLFLNSAATLSAPFLTAIQQLVKTLQDG